MAKEYRKYDSAQDELNFVFSYNEDETSDLNSRINNNPEIDANDLRRISPWKMNRVLSVSDDTLEKLRKIAARPDVTLDDDLVKAALEDLVNSQGIGFPMASAILKFLRPDVFPIIDVRAYRALTGKKLYYSTYNYKKYSEYAQALVKISQKIGRPLREIDEQLYCFDEKHNQKI